MTVVDNLALNAQITNIDSFKMSYTMSDCGSFGLLNDNHGFKLIHETESHILYLVTFPPLLSIYTVSAYFLQQNMFT